MLRGSKWPAPGLEAGPRDLGIDGIQSAHSCSAGFETYRVDLVRLHDRSCNFHRSIFLRGEGRLHAFEGFPVLPRNPLIEPWKVDRHSLEGRPGPAGRSPFVAIDPGREGWHGRSSRAWCRALQAWQVRLPGPGDTSSSRNHSGSIATRFDLRELEDSSSRP
jgi:hypothetical protein